MVSASKVRERLQRSCGQSNGSLVCCITKAGKLTSAKDSLIMAINYHVLLSMRTLDGKSVR